METANEALQERAVVATKEFPPIRSLSKQMASSPLRRPTAEVNAQMAPTRRRGLWARLHRFYRQRKRSLFEIMILCELVYIFLSVPLRFGFMFDPYSHGDWHNEWTTELSVFTTLDLLADLVAIANFYEIFAAQRRALAARAASVSGPVGSRHNNIAASLGAAQSGLNGGTPAPARQRRASLFMQGKKSSLLVAWSLNTLVPAITLKSSIRKPVILEVIAMTPLELLSIPLGPNSLHVLRTLKLFRLYRVPECLRELKSQHAQSRIVQQLDFTGNALLVKTVARGIALCHWIACMYMAIAHFECGVDFMKCSQALSSEDSSTSTGTTSTHHRLLSESTSSASELTTTHTTLTTHYTCWAIEDHLVGTTLTRQYGRSVYWSSRTLITLAYYDATPVTDIETIFGIIVLITGAVFSTSVLATFLFIFRYRNSRLQEFMAHVDSAKEFMKSHNFPLDVREGVLSFYKNAWATHQGLYQGEVIERLPEHLSVSVYSVLKVQRLQNVVFLTKESIEFINTLAHDIELCVYSPKDWIIEKIADGMYFVLRGNVLLDSERSRSGQTPRFAKAGDHFAESCLLYPGRPPDDERARAQTFCELYKLPHRSFLRTLTVFYRGNASMHLERMRSMLLRRDQQEQKMKRMLGRSAQAFLESTASVASIQARASVGRVDFVKPDEEACENEHSVHWLRRQWISFQRRHRQRQKQPWNMPGSTFRHAWEYSRFLMLTFEAFEVPLFLVFDSTSFPFGDRPLVSFQSLSSVAVEIFFVVDFVLRARFFAFIDQLAMIPVTDPSYIFAHYKENGMLLDLIAVVPVALITEFAITGPLTWLAIFRASRLLRLRHLPQTIQDFAHARSMSSKAQEALTLFLYVTLAIHISGCLWFLMARFNMKADDFFLDENHDGHADVPLLGSLTRSQCLRDAGLHGNCSWAIFDAYGQIGTAFPIQKESSIYTGKFAYLRAIYWSIVALTTIGYGDIVAFATSETYFAAVWAFIGGIINYGVVGAMSNIISNLTAGSHHHLEKMNNINLVLAHFRVSERVCAQIRSFYHQQFYVQRVSSEAKLLEHLPAQLGHRISLELHSASVRKVSLFIELAGEHPRLLHSLTGLFRRRIYQRGDTFFPDNSVCDEMVVMVSGRANVFSKRTDSIPVGALSEGSCYGVCELILRKPYPTSVVAATMVDVSVINYEAFSATIERRFPAELQVLRLRALQQHVADTLSLEAIIDNIKTQSTVAKFTDKCTSMFVDMDDWANHVRKTHLRLYWELAIFFVDMYNAFQITFRICFIHAPSELTWVSFVLLDIAIDVLLVLDVLLKLHYFECQGSLRNLITREYRDTTYVKHGLKWDTISCLPLYYVGSNFIAMSICRLPRLIRLRHVTEAFDSLIVRVQQRFSSGGNISAYLGPLKLALLLIFAAHFAGCVFYLISVTDHNPLSWIEHDHIVHQEHGSIGVLYLRSFYWALITLTLVGSREIVPLGVPGTVWAAFTSLCCAFIVGHIVGELSDLILDLDKTGKELKEREDRFEQFAKEHNLPSSIRTRAVHYLRFQHAYLRGMDIYETFGDLSPTLRIQLMLDLHGEMIRGLCIAPFLTDTQINALAVRLRSELYIPGDTIIVEGNLGHKLFIVKYGTAMVLWKATGTAVASLQTGSLFGEVAFFLRGQRRIATVQATTSSEMLVIDRRAWEDLLRLSRPEEVDVLERALINWVCDCLKGYNVMTVEIVKSIKLGDAVPPTIQELHTYNSAMRQQSISRGIGRRQLRPPPGHRRNRDSVGTIQEKRVRHLLRKAARQGHKTEKQQQPSASRFTVQAQRVITLLSMGLYMGSGTRAGKFQPARVYATVGVSNDEDCDSDDAEQSGTMSVPFTGNGSGSVKQLNGAWTVRSLPQTFGIQAVNGNGSFNSKFGRSTMQLNPVSTSMREYYGEGQLAEMEDECWRRYKVSLFLAESYIDRQQQIETQLNAQSIVMAGRESAKISTPTRDASNDADADDEDEADDHVSSTIETIKPGGKRIREARKTFCGAMSPTDSFQRTIRNSVTNDGMRWLANYETRDQSGFGSAEVRNSSDRCRSFIRKARDTEAVPARSPAPPRPPGGRVLKRSQSLPIFDRHFTSIIHAELQESSVKDHESKLNLGFELLQRCRQPEFSFLFQLYLGWLRRKRQWGEHRLLAWLFGKTGRASSVRPGAKSMRDLTPLQTANVARPSVDEENERKGQRKSSSESGTTSKAEAFLTLLTRYYRVWEGIVVIVAMFYAIALPFLICFMHDMETTVTTPAMRRWIGTIIFMDLFCVVDLILKYTAFQGVLQLQEGKYDEHNDEVPNSKHGEHHRSRHGLFLGGISMHTLGEVFAAIPLDFIVFLPGMHSLRKYEWYYLSILQLNKITRIYDAIQASERLAQLLANDLKLSVGDSLLRFVRSIGTYVLASHWIGCIWFRVSLYAEAHYDASWISTTGMLSLGGFSSVGEVSVMRKYLRSLYFSVQSTSTTFYGDIASLNVLELVVEINIILVCIFLFGALVGAQGQRIEAKYKRRMMFEQNLTSLHHFLKSNDVPRPVRHRLRLYYTNTWLKYHGEDDLDGVEGLSTLLIEDIAQYTMRHFATKVSILKSCDESFLRSLLTRLKHVICSANEAVVRKGDVDRSMYFIARGKVLVKGIGFELVKEEGDFFGELSLLYGIPRSATCSSLGVSLLYVLEWETYEKLLADFPEYREKNRREWVIVSTVLKSGESRFRSIVNIAARMEGADWVVIDDIIRKAKRLK